MEEALAELPARANKQQDVLRYLIEHPHAIRLTELMETVEVGASTVKSLADRGWIELREVEVMRDPYTGRAFARTKPLTLNGGAERCVCANSRCCSRRAA